MIEKPKTSPGDIAHIVAKAGLSAIPVIGGPAAELLEAIIVPPIAKRRDEWVESIAKGLKALEEEVEGFKLDSLSQNEAFITTVIHASQAAIRNHQKEKLEALRNAVLNAALPNSPEEDYQLMFLNFVDALTPWHLVILKFFDDPRVVMKQKGLTVPASGYIKIVSLLEFVFNEHELKNKEDFNMQIIKELERNGLIKLDPIRDPLGGLVWESALKSRITELGKKFISFISAPLPKDA